MNYQIFSITGIMICVMTWSFPIYAAEDSLTAAVCNHPEQIVSRTTTFRIQYVMNEQELPIRTVKGFLYNNGASQPYLKKFTMLRTLGYTMAGLGAGVVVTNIALDQPMFSWIGLSGYTMIIGGLTFSFNSNGKFRMAIYEYNKNICASSKKQRTFP